MRKTVTFFQDEEGSAIIEFIALALPLFLPLFLYLNFYAHSSDSQSTMNTLSREMARAFVVSENDEIAQRVSYEIFVKGANVLGYAEEISSGNLRYQVHCRAKPCISPDNEIKVTLTESKLNLSVSSVEYVSPWS